MADWGSFLSTSSGIGGRSMVSEDFDEDVWDQVKENVESGAKLRVSKEISGSSAWSLPAAPRTIPGANNTQTSNEVQVARCSSAPLEIPDWSKIYGRNAKKCLKDGESNGDAFGYGYGSDHYHGDGDEDGEDDMVPPHEWIARKLARSQISSFSVCEGIGRTLKGRDLSKVRNAILTKTGFIE